jgi:hypothetical protein
MLVKTSVEEYVNDDMLILSFNSDAQAEGFMESGHGSVLAEAIEVTTGLKLSIGAEGPTVGFGSTARYSCFLSLSRSPFVNY